MIVATTRERDSASSHDEFFVFDLPVRIIATVPCDNLFHVLLLSFYYILYTIPSYNVSLLVVTFNNEFIN